MIFNHKNLIIKTSDIQIKKPLQFSDQFIFCRLSIKKRIYDSNT